ncbi:MAG: M48 family metalloprotease [Minwuia sp.]|uniref:M48 family metalloprotease n=1 Tax=Minwuia sp. TaxID=2493630 RepID=UPI003A8B6FD2
MRIKHRILPLILIVLMGVGATASRAQQKDLSIVRDAEIEHILSVYAKPLFEAAGLHPGAVKVYLVQDDTLNAFVAGGQRIFVFTGLILATRSPGELVGVLAHETGHIRGGHLSRTRDAISNAQAISIVAALLGGLAAAASGRGDAAGAGVLGGSAFGTQFFLEYSRTQESAADQAAIKLMERTGWSPRGMVDFLRVLDAQELMLGQRGNPYLRSHPVGYERIQALEHLIDQSPMRDTPVPPELVRAHEMMQAKLFGFTRSPSATFQKWPESDRSDAALYARSVAYMQQARTDQALAELRPLIEKEPENPYFHELEGQILLEGGRVQDSLPPLRRALEISRHETIAVLLAQALIGLQTDEANREAVGILEQAVRTDPDMPAAWQQLAVGYGRNGNLGKSALASAELYYRSGQVKFAREQVVRAKGLLDPGSPDYFRAQDIEFALDDLERRAD